MKMSKQDGHGRPAALYRSRQEDIMFQGFTRETLAFFSALRFNNNRAFFEENRDIYENEVRSPLLALADALAPTVQKIDPQMDIRPARTVSRIHRDLRFRKDKTPYRDYMWIGFRHVGESREETCGFYFDISADAANWGCGYYHMQPETMKNLRNMLLNKPQRVLKVIENKAFARVFSLMGDDYVRQYQPPEGMPESLGALYRKKSVYAEHHLERMDDLFDPGLAERIAKDFLILEPFYLLLRECMVKRIEEGQ